MDILDNELIAFWKGLNNNSAFPSYQSSYCQ